MTDDLSVDVVEEIDADDLRRRRFLQQLFDSYERAREVLVELDSADQDVGMRVPAPAVAPLADLIRLVEPLVSDKPLWDEEVLGVVDVLDSDGAVAERPIRGLAAVLEYRNGVPSYVEHDTPGRGGATTYERGRRELPVAVVHTAFRELTEFLHEENLLVASPGEETATPGPL